MKQKKQITKSTAILLSVLVMTVIPYFHAVSSIYATHKHDHHDAEACVICPELYTARNLNQQFTVMISQTFYHAVICVCAAVSGIGFINCVSGRNLITDKVRMDR